MIDSSKIDELIVTLAWWSFRSNGHLTAARRSIKGTGCGHAHWLLRQVMKRKVTGAKAERWLCYAQGALVAAGALSLGNCIHVNMEAKLPEMVAP